MTVSRGPCCSTPRQGHRPLPSLHADGQAVSRPHPAPQPKPAPRPAPTPQLPPSPHESESTHSLSSMVGTLTSHCQPVPQKYMDYTEGNEYDDHHQALASKYHHNSERPDLVSQVGPSHVFRINNVNQLFAVPAFKEQKPIFYLVYSHSDQI